MKKFLIGAAIALAVTSCGAVLEALITDPLFNIPEKLYDGQIYRITRLGSCFYEWHFSEEVLNEGIARFDYLDKDGKPVSDIDQSDKGNVRLSVKLKDSQTYRDITIYANNYEDITAEEKNEKTTIKGWCLAPYQVDLRTVEDDNRYTPGKTVYIGMSEIDSSKKPVKNGRVVGEDEKTKGTGIRIGFKDSKDQYTGLKWEISGPDASKYDVEKLHTLLKLTPKAGCTGKITIKATLGYGEDISGEIQNKIGAVSRTIELNPAS
ncbi:MAG: hypothetical protein IKR69_03075 [Bacteroidales bacterium]|nr:hypothetical protein [Bacteroidales bacterium]